MGGWGRHWGSSRGEGIDTRFHSCQTVAPVENTVFHNELLLLCLCCALWPRRCYGPTLREEACLLRSGRSEGHSGRKMLELLRVFAVRYM